MSYPKSLVDGHNVMWKLGWNLLVYMNSLIYFVKFLFNNLERNAIDGACLEVLNDDDLNELGISSNVKKKKIMQWI